jgi:mRNA-degrading endonuclease RelE of RelBE toxin-antitoxin system
MTSVSKGIPFQITSAPCEGTLDNIIPSHDQARVRTALDEMGENPLRGDIRKLQEGRDGFRRRVGDWRIFFDLDPEERRVVVTAIERRTSTTY